MGLVTWLIFSWITVFVRTLNDNSRQANAAPALPPEWGWKWAWPAAQTDSMDLSLKPVSCSLLLCKTRKVVSIPGARAAPVRHWRAPDTSPNFTFWPAASAWRFKKNFSGSALGCASCTTEEPLPLSRNRPVKSVTQLFFSHFASDGPEEIGCDVEFAIFNPCLDLCSYSRSTVRIGTRWDTRAALAHSSFSALKKKTHNRPAAIRKQRAFDREVQ